MGCLCIYLLLNLLLPFFTERCSFRFGCWQYSWHLLPWILYSSFYSFPKHLGSSSNTPGTFSLLVSFSFRWYSVLRLVLSIFTRCRCSCRLSRSQLMVFNLLLHHDLLNLNLVVGMHLYKIQNELLTLEQSSLHLLKRLLVLKLPIWIHLWLNYILQDYIFNFRIRCLIK